MDKVHHIVFHDNIDGIISAAMYLNSIVVNDTYRLYPMSSIGKKEKFELIIKSMKLKPIDFLVILNYENHRESSLWIDHHWSKEIGNDPVINSKVIYDPHASSTARLLNEYLKPISIIYSNSFLDMVDTINKSNYKSLKQIFNDTHPLMVLRAYIEKSFRSEMMFCRIVEMLSSTNFNFKKALYQLKLNRRIIFELQKDVEKTKKAIVISDNMSIIRQSRLGKYPRYAEFYINPKVKYSIRLSTISQNRVYFQIDYNRWHNQLNEVNIGHLLSGIEYLVKSNGHHNIGDGIVHEDNVERLLDNLCINFNNGGLSMTEEMEKVGVDKEYDPIESKAESMVKTGESKNIDEARKKASKSLEKEKEENNE